MKGLAENVKMGTWMILLAAGLMLIGLTACGVSQKLSEDFDETEVKAAAEALVGYINEDDLEGLCSVPMSDLMKEAMTVEQMEAVLEQNLGNRGAFVEYKSNVAVGGKDSEGVDAAVAVVVAKYENKTVTYTISYDKEMNLIGFYLK